jgi:hypothetical protein
MAKYWAIKACETCGEPIQLQEYEEGVNFAVPDLAPIPCPCGGSYLYGSDDVTVIEKQ